MNPKLIFESRNLPTFSAYVRGNIFLQYSKDPWAAIVKHLLQRSHDRSFFTAQQVKNELFPKMPLFACKNLCLKLTELGAAEQTSEKNFKLTAQGREIAATEQYHKPLGDEQALALTWTKIGKETVIVRAEIQAPDSKSKIFVPEDARFIAELLRSPTPVKNGDANVVLQGTHIVFGSKSNGGAEEKKEKAELTVTRENATITVSKTPLKLSAFPLFDDFFCDVNYLGLRLAYDANACAYKATVPQGFFGEFPFLLPISRLCLPKVQSLMQVGCCLSAKNSSIPCVPATLADAQRAFEASIAARLAMPAPNDEASKRYFVIVENLKKEFADRGFHNLTPPPPDDFLTPAHKNNLPILGGFNDFLASLSGY